MNTEEYEDRHPATQEKMQWFDYEHLSGRLREVSSHFAGLAITLLDLLNDGPQLTIALDKLREAKDRAVSQAVVDAKSKADADDS